MRGPQLVARVTETVCDSVFKTVSSAAPARKNKRNAPQAASAQQRIMPMASSHVAAGAARSALRAIIDASGECGRVLWLGRDETKTGLAVAGAPRSYIAARCGSPHRHSADRCSFKTGRRPPSS